MPLIPVGNRIPNTLSTQFAIVNLVRCRLTPTRCFSKTSPTYNCLFLTKIPVELE
ncbi:MAG: hypothetical protein LBL62_11300 [Planctomycetaceae bacterium]|nr:hypothetical protein [Planctomycetaceae bacterium]